MPEPVHPERLKNSRNLHILFFLSNFRLESEIFFWVLQKVAHIQNWHATQPGALSYVGLDWAKDSSEPGPRFKLAVCLQLWVQW